MLFNNELYLSDISSLANVELPWENLSGSTILVTGATGMICSFLIDYLMFRNVFHNEQIKVIATGRNEERAHRRFGNWFEDDRFIFIKQDICYPFTINLNIDFIIHGASNADPITFANDPVGVIKANIFGMSNLLDLARVNNTVRTVFISSGEVYGEGNPQVPGFSEDYVGYINFLDSRSCYPSSKRASETLCIAYNHQYKQDVVIARPCHIYGATFTENDSRVFAQFFRNAINHHDIVLKSKGIQIRSYCYVADSVSALFYILFYGKPCQAYNISDKNSVISIGEFAEKVASLSDQKIYFDIPGSIEKSGYSKINNLILDSTKLETLGWQAKTDLNTGIRKTLEILNSSDTTEWKY